MTGRTTLLPNGNGRGQAGCRQSLNERNLSFLSLDFGGKHEMPWGELKWSLFRSTSAKDEILKSVRFDRNGFRWAYDRPDSMRPDYRVVNEVRGHHTGVRRHQRPDRHPGQEFVLYHTEGTDAWGAIQSLKLADHTGFQCGLQLLRAAVARKQAQDAAKSVTAPGASTAAV